VLHAQRAVGERHLAILHEVGRSPAAHEVLHDRAATAEVEAECGRRERRDQQHRVALGLDPSLGPVVVDLAQHAVVDQGAGHRSEIGQAAVQHLVGDVAGRGDDLVRLGDQIHGRRIPSVLGMTGV
jgi:hypothetical protein